MRSARAVLPRSAAGVALLACTVGLQGVSDRDAPSGSGSAGGGPSGGSVYSLVVAPSNASMLYASFWRGGIFVSVDGGSSWAPSEDQPEGFCDLAADPAQASTAYAACTEGVFKTADGGRRWSQLAKWVEARKLHVAPSDSRILYATVYQHLFVSRNEGLDWQEADAAGVGEESLDALAVDRTNPSVIYAGTSGGVLRSVDAGRTFWTLNGGLPDGASVVSLAIDTLNPQTMYAGTDSHGLFKRTAAGGLWRPVGDGSLEGAVREIVVAPSSSDVLYARGGDTFFRSDDAGGHWTTVHSNLEAMPTARALVVSPASASTAYALARGELQRTLDGGAHWAPALSGVSRQSVYDLVVESGRPSMLHATTGAGASTSRDDGESWQPLQAGGFFRAADVQAINPDGAGGIVVRTKAGVFRRGGADEPWTRIAIDAVHSVTLTFAPSDRLTVYAAVDQKVRATRDGGLTWSPIATPLDGRTMGPIRLAVAPHDPAILIAGGRTLGRTAGLWRSNDGGRSWAEVLNEPGRMLAVHVPMWDPADSRTVYVVADGIGIGGAGGVVRKSVDAGLTWNELEMEGLTYLFEVLPTRPSTLITQLPDFSGRGAFQLLKSTDGGRQWVESQVGLPSNLNVTRIVADPGDARRLFAAVDSRGVFRSVDGGATWVPTSAQ